MRDYPGAVKSLRNEDGFGHERTDIRDLHLLALPDGLGRAQHCGPAGELHVGVGQARVVYHGELAVQEEAGLPDVSGEAVKRVDLQLLFCTKNICMC